MKTVNYGSCSYLSGCLFCRFGAVLLKFCDLYRPHATSYSWLDVYISLMCELANLRKQVTQAQQSHVMRTQRSHAFCHTHRARIRFRLQSKCALRTSPLLQLDRTIDCYRSKSRYSHDGRTGLRRKQRPLRYHRSHGKIQTEPITATENFVPVFMSDYRR